MTTNVEPTDNSTGQEIANAGTDKTFSQDELEAIIKDRLKRQKDHFDAQQAKVKQQEQDAQLQAQAEYKTLAEQRETRIKELEPLQDEVAALRAVIEQQLAAAKKDMPKHITALLDDMSPTKQLAWIADYKADITKPAAPDINAGNRGGGGAVNETRSYIQKTYPRK